MVFVGRSLPSDYRFQAHDEVLIRRQFLAEEFSECDAGDVDITEQMPINEEGNRFMHPGNPMSEPFILRAGERMLLRKHDHFVDLILVR